MLSCGRAEISYGGFRLDKYPYVVDEIGVYSAPSYNVERSRLLRAGSSIIDSQYGEKIIPISGRIISAGKNKLQMERALDTLHRTLSSPSKDLKVGFEDLRYYASTRLDGSLEAQWNELTKEYIEWNAKILAHDPFAYAVEESSHIDTTTSSDFGSNHRMKFFELESEGSALTWPIITITFPGTAPSPYGTTLLWIINTTTQPTQLIQITRTFSASDVVEIDCLNQTVKINTILTDFDGQFIFIDPRIGPNTIEIHTTSTVNPTLSVSVTWKDRFLS